MNLVPDITAVLHAQAHLEFAVLVGSRACGQARPDSDWDIALSWDPQLEWLDILGRTERLRHQLAASLQVPESCIDLIELRRANLAMRASAAEEGRPLVGDDTVPWALFLRRTWRELEDFYWERSHAA